MKVVFKSILLLCIMFSLSMVATSCKKYEEGPALSLRSKKARVVNKWKAEKVTENGKDVTADYKDITWEFKDDNKFVITVSGSGGLSITLNGTWEFNNDKTKIITILNGERTESEILRLKEKSLWVKQVETDAGVTTTIEIHLIPA